MLHAGLPILLVQERSELSELLGPGSSSKNEARRMENVIPSPGIKQWHRPGLQKGPPFPWLALTCQSDLCFVEGPALQGGSDLPDT